MIRLHDAALSGVIEIFEGGIGNDLQEQQKSSISKIIRILQLALSLYNMIFPIVSPTAFQFNRNIHLNLTKSALSFSS